MLDAVDCERYIHMSSTSVYDPKHNDTVEADFDGGNHFHPGNL